MIPKTTYKKGDLIEPTELSGDVLEIEVDDDCAYLTNQEFIEDVLSTMKLEVEWTEMARTRWNTSGYYEKVKFKGIETLFHIFKREVK